MLSFVRFIRNIVNGVGAVDAHAALDAAANFLAEHAGHVLLLVQVVRVLMDVGVAVDSLSREVGDGRHRVPDFPVWLPHHTWCRWR